MWTPLQWFRELVQKQARVQIEELLEGYEEHYRDLFLDEIRKRTRDWILLENSHTLGPIGAEVVLLEREFDYPTEITGYIDASTLAAGDECGIKLLTEMFGRKTLTPLYASVYSGPVEDFVSLHPQIVTGKVKIVHLQGAGTPRIVAYKFFSR